MHKKITLALSPEDRAALKDFAKVIEAEGERMAKDPLVSGSTRGSAGAGVPLVDKRKIVEDKRQGITGGCSEIASSLSSRKTDKGVLGVIEKMQAAQLFPVLAALDWINSGGESRLSKGLTVDGVEPEKLRDAGIIQKIRASTEERRRQILGI